MVARTGKRRPIGGRLYLIVDGKSDRVFWQNHLKQHFPGAAAKVQNLESADPATQFNEIMKDAGAQQYAHIVFLTDEDASSDPSIRVKRLRKRVSELHRKDPQLARRVRVFGVRRGIEAWSLSDDKAIRSLLKRSKYRCKKKTDGLPDPKSTARRLCEKQYGKNYAWTPDGFASEMVCKMDFNRACKWSDSLRAFWDEMSKVFNQWR